VSVQRYRVQTHASVKALRTIASLQPDNTPVPFTAFIYFPRRDFHARTLLLYVKPIQSSRNVPILWCYDPIPGSNHLEIYNRAQMQVFWMVGDA
jgi:hypothetical protein